MKQPAIPERTTVEPIRGISLPSPDTHPTVEGTVERQRTALAAAAAVDVAQLVGLEVLDGGGLKWTLQCVNDIPLQL